MKIDKKHFDKKLYKALALWAAECAEHVLSYFEKEFPADKRPRMAIKALRKWARDGIFRMADVRKASLGAHAAAREALEDSAARFAARSAGQAVAASHVPMHAIGASYYGVKAAKAAGVSGERTWQYRRLPKRLRPVIKEWEIKKNIRYSR